MKIYGNTDVCPSCNGHLELSCCDGGACCENCTIHRGTVTESGEERKCGRCGIFTEAVQVNDNAPYQAFVVL